MRQLKVPAIAQQIQISGDEARHLIFSLRSEIGEKINVVDKTGQRALVEFTDIDRATVIVTAELIEMLPPAKTENITLAVGIPKKGLKDIIRQATEIGVYAIQPIYTERTIARPSIARQERWQKIAKEAAEQSGTLEPMIKAILPLEELIHNSRGQLIFCNETEREQKISEVKLADEFTIIIGSEGGFAEREINLLKGAGAVSVTLGENILKVDTAAIFALASVKLMMNK